MLYSKLFGKTVKDTPKDITFDSHMLLYRGGFIRESAAGRYFFLPLGIRVQDKIMRLIEEEMNYAGAQKMLTPTLHPLELWKETNRTNTTGFELMRVKDRREAEFALGGTAEEMFVDVVRKFKLSYKDLPINIYQFSNKFRDELRARGGLLRVREFIMKDAYSFDVDEKSFRHEYEKMGRTYSKIFKRLGLDTKKVLADNGYIGGEYCHEYIADCPIGESRYLESEDGSYVAHEDVAMFLKDPKNLDEELKPLEEVEAVRGTTMEDGVNLHSKPLWLQIKDVLFVDERGRFILAIIRGDYDVNEIKLMHITEAVELRPATEEEIRGVLHSEPGFISPVGIKKDLPENVELLVVADNSLRTIRNAYGGANKKHRDLFNMNIDRDYKADLEGDIALAQNGYTASDGKSVLVEKRGVEVGNIFQLGYHYSTKMRDAVFVDNDGKTKPFYMGCYGIGVGRTLATIVELFHDEKGIIWPEEVAPYTVHLVGLDLKETDVKAKALELYANLERVGVEVLFDDREDVTAGEKFADADLIGCPWRIVVSRRTTDEYEIKKRSEKEAKTMEWGGIKEMLT